MGSAATSMEAQHFPQQVQSKSNKVSLCPPLPPPTGLTKHEYYAYTSYRYKIIVGRSTKVTGPFVDESGVAMTDDGGTTIMASNGNVYAPGGQGVFTDADGVDVLYYHYCKPTNAPSKGKKDQ